MDYKSIGKKIKVYREKQGLTQQDLADSIGVTWEMVSRYERGVSSPINRIDRIAEALNATPIELLQKDNIASLDVGCKAPLFILPPSNGEFTAANTRYVYTIPEWILRNDPMSFAIDCSIVKIKTMKIKSDGPLFVSPSLEPSSENIVLIYKPSNLDIDFYRNVVEGEVVKGIVVAQEVRF